MQALKEAQKHVLFHHGNADGWITLAKKDPKTNRFNQYHYQPSELAEVLTEWLGEDVYFSQNTFYKPKRRIDTIRQLRSLYVDLDVYTKGLTPEYVLAKLEYEFFGETIPQPNMVIFSGRGLVLVWHIEPIPYKAMPLWKSVEGYLVEQLKDLGADSKATDPARIFRIAGTTNSKSDTMVKAEFVHDYRYDIHQIQYDYLPELAPKKLEQKPGRKSKVVRLFNIYTLHLARARDIAKLVELREGDCKSYREVICFLYRYYTACYTDDAQQALADTLDLNEEFTSPLPQKEVERATKSAETAWKARSSEKANELAKSLGYPGAGYNIKNSDLIEWLGITEEEQQHLDTIIGKAEKRRRDRIKKEKDRRAAGTPTRAEYNTARKEIVESKAEIIKRALTQHNAPTVRELAEITGLSKSTIHRILKTLG